VADKAFFIGGPGTLSASAIQGALERGYQVGVFSSGGHFDELPPGVKTYRGQRNNLSALRAALEDFHPDVAIDFICFTPEEAQQDLELFTSRVRQFIFISTVDVYGYPLARLPFHEDDPWRAELQSSYAQNKRLCEEILRPRFHPTHFPLTIVRPAYAFGPRFILSFMSRAQGVHMLRRLQTGRPVLVPGDGTTLMHVGSAYNTGKMIAALLDFPPAIGKDYTCGHPTFTTHDGYVQLFATALGVQPNIVHIPTDQVAAIEHPEIRGCLLHALTRFNVAFSIDRFLRDLPLFRWEYTLEDWAREVVEWNIRNKRLETADEPILDDAIVKAFQQAIGELSI